MDTVKTHKLLPIDKVDHSKVIDLRERTFHGSKSRLLGGEMSSMKELFLLDEAQRPGATLLWEKHKIDDKPIELKNWLHPFEFSTGTETKILHFLESEELVTSKDLRLLISPKINDLVSLVPILQRSKFREAINKLRENKPNIVPIELNEIKQEQQKEEILIQLKYQRNDKPHSNLVYKTENTDDELKNEHTKIMKKNIEFEESITVNSGSKQDFDDKIGYLNHDDDDDDENEEEFDLVDNEHTRGHRGRALYREGARRYQAVKQAAKRRKLPWDEFLKQNPRYQTEMDYVRSTWEEASELGSGGKSDRALGVLYHLGRGVTLDPHKARELYERAANLGTNDKAKASANVALGVMQERGQANFRMSAKDAKKRYEEAGELSAHGLFNLANYHRKNAIQEVGMDAICTFGGDHLSKKAQSGLHHATHSYHKAIKLHHHPNSAFNLAIMHQSGMLHGKDLHPDVMKPAVITDEVKQIVKIRSKHHGQNKAENQHHHHHQHHQQHHHHHHHDRHDRHHQNKKGSHHPDHEHHTQNHNNEALRLFRMVSIFNKRKKKEVCYGAKKGDKDLKTKQAEKFALRLLKPETPLLGEFVFIKDVKRKHEINGKKGIAFYYDKATSRYSVKLDGGSILRMKPENLEKQYVDREE